jgi:hypothetical protein
MPRKTLFVLCMVSAALLLGCHKSETTNNSNSTSASNSATSTNSAGSTTSTSSSSASSGEKIGIEECDDFITKYDACVSSKVPEAQRAKYKDAIAEWRKQWKQLAANPMTKGTLASICKQAADQQNSALKGYGCSF